MLILTASGVVCHKIEKRQRGEGSEELEATPPTFVFPEAHQSEQAHCRYTGLFRSKSQYERRERGCIPEPGPAGELVPQDPEQHTRDNKENHQKFGEGGVPRDGLLVSFIDGEETGGG